MQASVGLAALVELLLDLRQTLVVRLTAVLGLVGNDGVLRLFTLGGGSCDLVFEGEILTVKNRRYLGRLHAVVFRHSECKRLEETLFFDAHHRWNRTRQPVSQNTAGNREYGPRTRAIKFLPGPADYQFSHE